MAWVYEFEDEDGIGTYTGKHGGAESLGTRINRHFGLDAEHTRHADSVAAHRVDYDDLDHEEQMAIKQANDGDGPVFNKAHNDGGWAERYYDGYDTRSDPDEEPDPDRSEARNERAAGNYEYEARRRRS